ncbi:unnamed protein product [Ceratitis capitata]|uniref:(Mediterranean fruit fly) hypothetical protein n=1 Tax=Ceratitis capitata TaxID=7213 RepID=A0A811V1P7_CERCA|nr:unnamed protein product [Ceratitis capitata]
MFDNNPNIQLNLWRAVQQCGKLRSLRWELVTKSAFEVKFLNFILSFLHRKECAAPLHNDCYKRRCEPSCDSRNTDDCPIIPDACFPGCYCPEGTVRQGKKCITVAECKDCVCNSFGKSQFFTYDKRNSTSWQLHLSIVTRYCATGSLQLPGLRHYGLLQAARLCV